MAIAISSAMVNGTVASTVVPSMVMPSTVKPVLVNRVATRVKVVAVFIIKQHRVVVRMVVVETMGVMVVVVVERFIITTLFIPFTVVTRGGVGSILKEVPATMEVILNPGFLYLSSGIVQGAVDDVLNRMPVAEVARHDDCGMRRCNKIAKVEKLDL